MDVRRRVIFMLAIVGLAPIPPAHAQTQYEINTQARAAFDVADKSLNAAYGTLMAQGSPQGRNRLRQAQRDWLRFRDSDCEARAGSRGGSFYPTSLLQCREALTRERAKTLVEELRCREGDLSCGGVTTPD